MKGVVIGNCGTLGLDWERLSLSGYLEALTARSDKDGAAPDAEATPRMKRFMAAHKGATHAQG